MGSYFLVKETIETGKYPDLDEKFKQLKNRRRFMKGYLIGLLISVITLTGSFVFSEVMETIPFFAKIKVWFQGAIVLKACITMGTLTILFFRSFLRYKKMLLELKNSLNIVTT